MTSAIRQYTAKLADKVLDSLLPRHCLLCGQFSDDSNLCPPCNAGLPRSRHACMQCGLPVPAAHDRICGSCLRTPPPWQHATAGLEYRFPVDQLVCRFKFGRSLACGEILGTELWARIRDQPPELPDLIVPVPLHRSRQFFRNFNQADLIARLLGRELGIPVRSNLLRRVRRTRAQSGLDARRRRQNLKGAFSFSQKSLSDPGKVSVALVDDVCTTGETLAACTKVLNLGGVRNVSIWVAARAPPP